MKKYFVSGLIVLLPLVITISIVNFFVNVLTKPFLNATTLIGLYFGGVSSHWAPVISKLLVLVVIAGTTMLIGALARGYIARRLLQVAEYLVFKIPFVSSVYRASRDVIHTLLSSKETAFQEVVLVPFPHKETYSLGFLVRKAPNLAPQFAKEDFASVFIPTTPNPTTGFIIVYQNDQITTTNLSVEDGLKYIISCGVIQPASFQAANATHFDVERS